MEINKRVFILAAQSRFLVVILVTLHNVEAQEYLKDATDGDEFMSKLLEGEKPQRPGVVLFTAPYKLCVGSTCESDLAMAFPLFVGKKGKEVYKKLYARDRRVIHKGNPNAPFKPSTTKPTTTTTTKSSTSEEKEPSPKQCMNVNVDLELVTKVSEEKETVTCPSLPTTTTHTEPETTTATTPTTHEESSTTHAETTEIATTETITTEAATTETATTERVTTESASTEAASTEAASTEATTTEATTTKATTTKPASTEESSNEITMPEVTEEEVVLPYAAEADTDEEDITTTPCPTAPTCEEETTVPVTCPPVTGCIKRRKMKHKKPRKPTTPMKALTLKLKRSHKTTFRRIPSLPTPKEKVTRPRLNMLRQFLKKNLASTTPSDNAKDYFYYYYIM